MDIEGLGEAVCEQLLATGLAKTPADLYRLTKEELLGLEGFQKKKAENILSALEKSKHNELGALLFGLGIRNIGDKAAKLLAQRFGSLQAVEAATKEELLSIEGFGESWPRVFCNTLTMKITVGCAMICWPWYGAVGARAAIGRFGGDDHSSNRHIAELFP